MFILDETSDKSLSNIILYLTPAEAVELRDSLKSLIEKPIDNHSHISNINYDKEITVCIYDTNDLTGFDQRSIDLITNDK